MPDGRVWLLGRFYCTGTPGDFKAVHARPDQLSLVPFSAWSKPYTLPPGKLAPSIDMKTAGRYQVNAFNAAR